MITDSSTTLSADSRFGNCGGEELDFTPDHLAAAHRSLAPVAGQGLYKKESAAGFRGCVGSLWVGWVGVSVPDLYQQAATAHRQRDRYLCSASWPAVYPIVVRRHSHRIGN